MRLLLQLENSKGLKELIEADGLGFGSRSKASLKAKNDCLEVEIQAEDATSMRAAVNAVLKVVQIFEKSEKI
ncbi:MAG: KEOPS complex subunit Pcc1 [Candidatus Nanoarchaeia archaeon]